MKFLMAMMISGSLFGASFAQTSPARKTNEAAANSTASKMEQLTVTRSGSHLSKEAPAEYFTGRVTIDYFAQPENAQMSAGRVTFQPGARTAWHTHPMGQTLIVTAGVGQVQHWGGEVQEIRPGDVVWIPAGQKHWHGASATNAMTHIAIAEKKDGQSAEWMEQVSDEQFGSQTGGQADTESGKPSQKAIGDFAPKLAELTDEVLYGDVWERPQLSKRDRSLVTVSALIALNRPDQLRSHVTRARDNGVTEEEMIETITHLAFYSGWPNAVTAIGVAKEVFQEKQTPTKSATD